MSNVSVKEPAIKSYFFGKGYRDLHAIIADGIRRNSRSAEDFFAKMPGWHWDENRKFWANVKDFLSSCLFLAAGIATLTLGNLLLIVAALTHGGILCIITAVLYSTFNILWATERVYLGIRAFFMACPNCHAHNILPEYICGRCGAIHAKLFPNSYGILIHHCKCGNKLPATFFLNRGAIKARCPACHHSLAREHIESTRIFVPIVGGPAAGKSTFLFSAVRELVEGKAANLGWYAKPFDTASTNAYRSVVALLKTGKPPDKTANLIPPAFNLTLNQDNKPTFLLYLYDPAGEAYQSSHYLRAHGFNNYLSGMVLIIDPFAIKAVREQYAVELEREQTALKPSELPIEDAVDYLLLSLETDFGLAKVDQIQAPLAIVLNKIDAFDLEHIIGETAVNQALANWSNAPSPDRNAVRDTILKTQLSAWGEQAFIQRIEARFSKVRYFTCSALGRMPNISTDEFTPNGVLPPLLWIFAQVNQEKFFGKIGSIHKNLRLVGTYPAIGSIFAGISLLIIFTIMLNSIWYSKLEPVITNIATTAKPPRVATNNIPSVDKWLRITTGAGVLLRVKPTKSSRSKGTVKFGTVVTELKREVKDGTTWGLVQLSNGKRGWIIAEFLSYFDVAQSQAIYLQIAKDKLTLTNNFGNLVEVSNFLANLVKAPTFTNNAEFNALLQQVVEKIYRLIPSGQENRSPYKEWLSKQLASKYQR